MNAIFDKRCARCLRPLSDRDLEAAVTAMHAAAATFGQPHLHSGRGIQQLRPGLYECRSGLGLRLLFERHADTLHFVFAGNHDAVQAHLKNRRRKPR